MVELSKNEIKFILNYYILCKDLLSLEINHNKQVFLSKKDYEMLKAIKNLSKGY